MLLMLDNYDSFTYNLVQYFQCLNQEVQVYQNDGIDLETIYQINPQYIVISPGPNAPENAGISLDLIYEFHQNIPILGICLGHQCIAQAFGATIIQASQIMHGKTSIIQHKGQNLFHNIPNDFQATRYHSLCIDPSTLPECFSIDAWSEETIMAISHKEFPLFGMQFHPEAILSEHGMRLLSNFLRFRYLKNNSGSFNES